MSPTHPHAAHSPHRHTHAPGCGHISVRHGDHVDYLHEGHLHRHEGEECRECAIEADARNPAQCTPQNPCAVSARGHRHGPGCGHPSVPHADHTDFLVEGRLHHPHGTHCDDHGPLAVMP